MTINPKPGNQPDPDDMSVTAEDSHKAHDAAAAQRELEAEEEAARLGDFA
jgi:hypothetical protein